MPIFATVLLRATLISFSLYQMIFPISRDRDLWTVRSLTTPNSRCRLKFNNAEFVRPPLFLNSKLPDGLSLAGINWPTPKRGVERPEDFVQAYQKLKIEMDKQKLHEEEISFFGLEMKSRGAMAPRWRSVSIPLTPTREAKLYVPADGMAIALYGALSDYGRSYARPLAWLGLLIIVFWLLNLPFAKSTGEAAGLSVVDTFRIFGVKEEFFKGIDSNMPIGLRILAAVQTIVGSALVFLFLLALQKKFRMK